MDPDKRDETGGDRSSALHQEPVGDGSSGLGWPLCTYEDNSRDCGLASGSRGTGGWHAVWIQGVNDEDPDCVHSCRNRVKGADLPDPAGEIRDQTKSSP